MSTQGGFELKGFKELGDLLAELPSTVQDKAAVKALRAGANVILAEAQQRAPVGTSDPFSHPAPPGQLRDSLKIRVDKPGLREGAAYIYADPGKGKKVGRGAFYAHMVEFGHKTAFAKGYTRGDGKSGGKKSISKYGASVGPHPFLAPACIAMQEAALGLIGSEIGKTLDQAVRARK